MFSAIQIWFAALSTAAKAGIVSAAVITSGTVVTALPSSPTAVVPATPKVEAVEPVAQCISKLETVVETEPIPFTSSTENDSKTPQGSSYVKSEGVEGVQTFTYEATTYSPAGCAEDTKKLIDEAVTTNPTPKITVVGTYVAPPPPKPSNCDPGYSPCVPNVSYDLDCPDIGFSVRVTGSDPHGFDRNNDGYGCESY